MALSKPQDYQDKPFHNETQCPTGVIAQIPWLPKRAQTMPFEQSDFYKYYFAGEYLGGKPQTMKPQEIEKRLVMRRILAESFPFFLPARYHTMNAAEIHKHAALPGSYWINAIHFVRVCSDFCTVPYYNIARNIWCDDPCMASCSIDGPECRFQAFGEAGPEQCESAVEFLLEPWVLIQLPFQPALLHQWTVAAMAESLKFGTKLAEITSAGFSGELLDIVNQLNEFNTTLFENCSGFLAHFLDTMIYTEPMENTISLQITCTSEMFFEKLRNTIIVLQVIMSAEMADILEEIKRKSWCSKRLVKDLETSIKVTESSIRAYQSRIVNIYNESYWFLENLTSLCPKISEEDIGGLPESLDVFSSYRPEADVNEKIDLYIINEVFKNDQLQGLKDPVVFFKEFRNYISQRDFYSLEFHVRFLEHLKGTDSRAPQVDKGGVLLDILSLHADFRAAGSLGTIKRLIWLAAANCDSGVYIQAQKNYTSEALSTRKLTERFKTLVPNDHEWTLGSLLRKAKTSCGIVESAPDFQCNLESLQNHFMKRIRFLLLKIFKRHYTPTQEGSFRNRIPECHFVQYILPCFVAMIADVGKNEDIKQRDKEDYYRFVHRLVMSFEENVHIEFLEENVKHHLQVVHNFESQVKTQLNEIVSTFKKVFDGSTKLQYLVGKLSYFDVHFGEALLRGNSPFTKLINEFPTITTLNSKVQLSRLLWRLQKCLKEVGWSATKMLTLDCHAYLQIFNFFANQTPDILTILKCRLGKLEIANTGTTKSSIKNSANLTTPQLFGIAIFLALKNQKYDTDFCTRFQFPLFKLDPFQLAISQIISDDWWSLKANFAPFTKGTQCEDLSLIPVHVALENYCCRPLLDSLTAGRKKVKLDFRGQVTFNPIQHCRWCGLVIARNFRLCPECKDEPDYPHPNYFCSEKCENVTLEKCHREEHARFIMEKLGI